MRNYDAVFFDAANTLLYPYPSVGAVYAEVAARYGVTTTADAVQAAFRRSWAEANAAADSDPVRYGVGEPDGRRFWHALVHATFTKIELPKDFEAFFDELYWLFSQPTVWRLYPECLAVLQTLRQRGYTVGVISNWDIRLLDLLHGLGLMACVQHVSISAVVGWEKPHGNIFAHALDAVGVAPVRAVHVGDSLHADVHGARQAGMQPLWLRRDDDAHRDGVSGDDEVIHDLNGVLDWLAKHDA
jgi:putative hydrolase of the HAD superfamily